MRGDGAIEDVDGDCPPHDGRVVGDDDDDDFPLWEGSSPSGSLRRSPRLVPPRFRLVAADFRPVSLPTIFSKVKAFI